MLAGAVRGIHQRVVRRAADRPLPDALRFTGVALVFNVAFTIFSGMSPLAATTVIRATGNAAAPAYLMIASAAIALAGSVALKRVGGNVLPESIT